MYKFSKVSPLLNLQRKMTSELTFENNANWPQGYSFSWPQGYSFSKFPEQSHSFSNVSMLLPNDSVSLSSRQNENSQN